MGLGTHKVYLKNEAGYGRAVRFYPWPKFVLLPVSFTNANLLSITISNILFHDT